MQNHADTINKNIDRQTHSQHKTDFSDHSKSWIHYDKELLSPNHIPIFMGVIYMKKFHDKAIKQAVNDLVEARRKDKKLQKNACTSMIDVCNEVKVIISRDA